MLTIIILIHNKTDMTRLCLKSICTAYANQKYEIICVDNASDESTAELQEEFKESHHCFNWLRNDENLSFSKANNNAVQSAHGDCLFFLNNDVMLDPWSIKNLLKHMNMDEHCGIAGLRLLYKDGKEIQHAGIYQMLWGYPSNFGSGAAEEDARFQISKNVFAVTGAAMAIRRSTFEKIGGFEEKYLWGYEDIDLCLKAKQYGYSVKYVAESTSIHLESATLSQVRKKQNEELNYLKYRSAWDFVLIPKEKEYIDKIKKEGIKKVAIFGTGKAGLGLFQKLESEGIKVAAFTGSKITAEMESYCGRPVIKIKEIQKTGIDCLIIGTQYYYQIEKMIKNITLKNDPIFPVIMQ